MILKRLYNSGNIIYKVSVIKMCFAQLDGEITNKQSQELLDKEYKKAIELENKNKEQKLEK